MIRALLRKLLCDSHGVHRVPPEDRIYTDNLEGGYEGPCNRCPEWAVDDRSAS
jgi:hypothetical protein